MRLEAVGKTDVGLRRAHNEDSYLIVEDQQLFVIADGMGGHNAGEVASHLAVETVAGFFDETQGDDDVTWPFRPDRGTSYHANRLTTAVKLANLRIHETAQRSSDQRGMGTTFVGMYVYRGDAIIAHVGDSRVYRLRANTLAPLTDDHSLLNDYLRTRDLTPEEIENFPRKNVILRALGMKDSVQVEVNEHKIESGDIYMICSDGLNGMATDPELEKIMTKHQNNLQDCADALIAAANDAGGDDNITVVLIRTLD